MEPQQHPGGWDLDNPYLQSMEEHYDSMDDEYMQEFFWKPEEHTVPEAESLWPGVRLQHPSEIWVLNKHTVLGEAGLLPLPWLASMIWMGSIRCWRQTGASNGGEGEETLPPRDTTVLGEAGLLPLP